MQTAMESRATVLGKRTCRSDSINLPDDSLFPSLPTPESTPNFKRMKTTATILGDDSNKENIPPFRFDAINIPQTPRPLRRTRTDATIPSSPIAPLRRSTSSSEVDGASSLQTPPPTPQQNLPIYLRARALLRTTCDGASTIAGRGEEREVITKFISSFLNPSEEAESSMAATLYISGTPGTGKTALVNAIVKDIDAGCKVVYVNCMACEGLPALFAKMCEEFGGPAMVVRASRTAKGKVKDTKDSLTSLLSKATDKCIFVLDELDHVAPAQALSSLFDLTHAHSSTLRVIGIANTHTLTAASSLAGTGSKSVTTLHFSPYSASQMLQIVQTRLAPLIDDPACSEKMKKFLPAPALTLLSKKIAAQTGDVRALFEVLRGAIDQATMSLLKNKDVSADSKVEAAVPAVTPSHVLAALKTYTPSTSKRSTTTAATSLNNEIITKVRDLGMQARLVLLAILLASKRLEANLSISNSALPSPSKPSIKRSTSSPSSPSGTATDIDPTALHGYYVAVLKRSTNDVFSPVSRSEFSDLLGLLETVGLVSLSSSASGPTTPTKTGRRSVGRSASFSAATTKSSKGQGVRLAATVRADEVLRGLGISNGDVGAIDPRQEEVNAIWSREQTKINRERKHAASPTKAADVFDDANED